MPVRRPRRRRSAEGDAADVVLRGARGDGVRRVRGRAGRRRRRRGRHGRRAGTRPTSLDAPVAVITPIDLDHQRFLGDTIAAIAAREGRASSSPARVAVLAAAAARGAPRSCAPVRRGRARPSLREGFEFGVARPRGRGRRSGADAARPRRHLRRGLPAAVRRHQAHNAAVRARRGRGASRRGRSRAARRRRRPRRRSPTSTRPAGSRSCARRRPCWSTPRTTRPARARWPTRCARRSRSPGSSASSACSRTRTPRASSARSSRCSTRSWSPGRRPRARSTRRTARRDRGSRCSARTASHVAARARRRHRRRRSAGREEGGSSGGGVLATGLDHARGRRPPSPPLR